MDTKRVAEKNGDAILNLTTETLLVAIDALNRRCF